MFKKNKFVLILIFFIAFLFSNGGIVYALEITSYPPIPGLVAPSANCTGSDCLSIYVAYWFGLLVYISGILSLISFTVGAVGLIASAESAEASSNAKDRMKGAVLGLVLTLSAFIILQTINPTLVTPTLTPLPGVAGIFYTNGSENKPAPMEEANIANVPQGFGKIIYKCVPGQENIAPALFIWEYPKPSFQGNDANYGGVNVARKKCGEEESISNLGSFKMEFETPGVYAFLGENCTGNMSDANLTSLDEISAPFAGKIKSVRVVSNAQNKLFYGVIFHNIKGAANGGDCTAPIGYTFSNDSCSNLSSYYLGPDFSTASADIFNWNIADPTSSGDGVDFYSEPDGWNSDKQAGQFLISNIEIKNLWTADFTKNPKPIVFDYTGVDSEIAALCNGNFPSCSDQAAGNNQSCCPCATFQDCPGSLDLKGNYLAAFYTRYTDKNNNKRLYCQTFNESVADLSLESFLPPGDTKLGLVEIIPTK